MLHVPGLFSDLDGRSPQVRQDNSGTEKMAICSHEYGPRQAWDSVEVSISCRCSTAQGRLSAPECVGQDKVGRPQRRNF